MRKHGVRLPSPALVLAVVALVAAFGGGAYAAKVQLGKGTVTTKTLKNRSVTNKKLAPPVRGAAVAWADVDASGQILAGRGIRQTSITGSGGFYCFGNLPDHGTASVTPRFTGDEFGSFAIATVAKRANDLPCFNADVRFGVATQFFNIGTDTAPYQPQAFTIVLHR